MKRISHASEPVVVVPIIVEVVQVQLAIVRVLVQIGHMTIAINLADGTKSNNRKLPLEVRLFDSQTNEVPNRGRFVTYLVHLGNDCLGGHGLVEVENNDFLFRFLAVGWLGELLGGDVLVAPVEVPCLHCVFDCHGLVDHNCEGVSDESDHFRDHFD